MGNSLRSTMIKDGLEPCVKIPPIRWMLAVARAEIAAQLYGLLLKENGKPSPQPLSKLQKQLPKRTKRVKKQKSRKTRPLDENDLWRLYKTAVSWSGGPRPAS